MLETKVFEFEDKRGHDELLVVNQFHDVSTSYYEDVCEHIVSSELEMTKTGPRVNLSIYSI